MDQSAEHFVSRFAVLCLFFFGLAVITDSQTRITALPPSKEWTGECKGKDISSNPLADGRKFVVVCDMLYLLDAEQNIVWSWSNGNGTELSNNILVDGSGRVFITGADNLLASIDLATGKKRWEEASNGTAPRTLVGLYGKDTYLLVISVWYYRHYFKDRYHQSLTDTLSICRDDNILWSTDIPNGSVIKVRGRNIFAVTKVKGKTLWRRLAVPTRLGKPQEKLSTESYSSPTETRLRRKIKSKIKSPQFHFFDAFRLQE